jgi:hypothetical protein
MRYILAALLGLMCTFGAHAEEQVRHQLGRGDNLHRMARIWYTSVEDILLANPILLPRALEACALKKRREEETREETPPAVRVPPTASPPVEPQPPQKSASQPKGSRLPADWSLSEDLAEWAMREVGMTAEAVRKEAAKFRDYWVAKAGRDATKADWPATWRNWCRNAWPPRNGPGGQGGIGGSRQGVPHDPAGRNAEAKRLLFGGQEAVRNQPEAIDA